MTEEPKKPDLDDELTGSLADGLTDAAPTELMSAHEAIRAARQIGAYRLIEQIGEGGMGEVWLAEQTEGVWRKVALKVIKPGMDTRSFIARFEAERQALAMMDHPTIAKVFDAGETADGRPYLVMEYIQGEPIHRYCDTHRLSTEERLELFVQVCAGIQHAHQKAIIHRDIKPSNVLVAIQDGKPVPKIIDFGVAKALAQPLTDKTMFTEHGQVVGTPAYMSPEQAEMTGLNVDTRTDIYSLGVMLYQLLVGVLPFDPKALREAGYSGMMQVIRESDPPRPSTRFSSLGEGSKTSAERRRTEPAKLRSVLEGDLDWVVMKAIEKDRNRRYETANGLAMDLRRYLAGEAVLAAPPSRAYLLKKLIRRHRGMVAATGAVAAAVFIGLRRLRVAGEGGERPARPGAAGRGRGAGAGRRARRGGGLPGRDARADRRDGVGDLPDRGRDGEARNGARGGGVGGRRADRAARGLPRTVGPGQRHRHGARSHRPHHPHPGGRGRRRAVRGPAGGGRAAAPGARRPLPGARALRRGAAAAEERPRDATAGAGRRAPGHADLGAQHDGAAGRPGQSGRGRGVLAGGTRRAAEGARRRARRDPRLDGGDGDRAQGTGPVRRGRGDQARVARHLPAGLRRRRPRHAELDQQPGHAARRDGPGRRGAAPDRGGARGAAARARRGSPGHAGFDQQRRLHPARPRPRRRGRAVLPRVSRAIAAGARRGAPGNADLDQQPRLSVLHPGRDGRGRAVLPGGDGNRAAGCSATTTPGC